MKASELLTSPTAERASKLWPVWRVVDSVDVRQNPGAEKHWAVGGRSILTLRECGHTLHRKNSAAIPRRARCRECESLRSGAVFTRFNTANRTAEVETWDQERRLPVRVTRPMTEDETRSWILRGRA